MARILRGDIVWAALDPTVGREEAGRRPILVISHQVFNERSGTVIGIDLSSQAPRAGFPLTLELRGKGLPKKSWAKISQVRTLSVQKLGRRIGRASPEELSQIVEGLMEIVGD